MTVRCTFLLHQGNVIRFQVFIGEMISVKVKVQIPGVIIQLSTGARKLTRLTDTAVRDL